MMKTVSVHIVTYNSGNDIFACLEAVLGQSYPIQQIIVIDNASTDGTPNLLEQFASNQVMIIYNQDNIGFAAAHNQAIHFSSAYYYLVLNPDVVIHTNYVMNLIRSFKEDCRLGSATGKLMSRQDAEILDSVGLMINRSRRAFDLGSGQASSKWECSVEVFGVSGAAALYCSEMVYDVSQEGQFFDERFFAYKEDVDVAWRAQLLGWKSVYVADATAFHERGWKSGGRTRQPLFIRRHSYINRYRMMIKNESIAAMIKHFLWILPYEVGSLGYFLLKEPAVLGAWGALIKDIPYLLEQRRMLQKRRKVPFRDVYKFFNET